MSAALLGIVGLVFFLYLHLNKWFKGSHIASQVHPYSGLEDQPLAWPRALLRSILYLKKPLLDGYDRYSRSSSLFVLPVIDRGAVTVIPPAYIKKIYDLPDDEVNVKTLQNASIQAEYTIANPHVINNEVVVKVLRGRFTRSLTYFTTTIAEELDRGFQRHWGTSSEWTDVYAWISLRKVMTGVANAIYVGKHFCQDDTFLDDMFEHADWVFRSAALLNILPPVIRHLIGPLFRVHGKLTRRKRLRVLIPMIQDRLSTFQQYKLKGLPTDKFPKDFLQFSIEEAYGLRHKVPLDAEIISERIMYINLVSLHTTSFSIANVLQDLLGSVDGPETIDDLRAECSRVLLEHGSFTFEALNSLNRLDSTIRESMRLSPCCMLGLPRFVTSPHGVEVTGDVVMRPGTPFAAPMFSIQRDDAFYLEPNTFHAFRFCSRASIKGASTEAKYMSLIEVGRPHRSTVALDERFLSFGFGKNACPGRFIALYEMKLALAYVLLNYELEHMHERPPQLTILWAMQPKQNLKIRVRRRDVGENERQFQAK